MSGLVIRGERVLLRDPRPEDAEARVRWVTVETAWQEWDAPWEGPSLVPPERAEQHRRKLREQKPEPPPTPRKRLYIERIGGPVLGWVGRYTDQADGTIRLGLDICESAYWGQGLGTEALRLWVGYLFDNLDVDRLGTATWSGNERMIRCAEKCGFVIVEREPGVREVRGRKYDALKFVLTRERWAEGGGDSTKAAASCRTP
jgi:RimJ/RimL family protein N-acetyltransferase